jgi:hypothetical protein
MLTFFPRSDAQTASCVVFEWQSLPQSDVLLIVEQLVDGVGLRVPIMEHSTNTSDRLYRGRFGKKRLQSAILSNETKTVFLLSKEDDQVIQKYESQECVAFDLRFNVTRLLIYRSDDTSKLLKQVLGEHFRIPSRPRWIYAYKYLTCQSPLLYFLGIAYRANRFGCPEVDWLESDRMRKWAVGVRAFGIEKARDVYPYMVVPAEAVKLYCDLGMQNSLEDLGLSLTTGALAVDETRFLRVRSMFDIRKLTLSS